MVNRSGMARVPDDVEVVAGDAADPQFTIDATRGARVVYQTLNPPYAQWVEQFHPRRTKALYEEGLAIARAVGEQDLVARFLNNMAIQERRAGNLQASLRMNQESLAIRREIGDRVNAAVSLNNIGNVLLDMGDLSAASEHYEQSAAASREIGDRRGLARALYNQAEALRLQGDLARARSHRPRGARHPAGHRRSGQRGDVVVRRRGDRRAGKAIWPAGARLLTEGLEMDRKLNRRRPMAYALYFLGEIALVQGDLGLARQPSPGSARHAHRARREGDGRGEPGGAGRAGARGRAGRRTPKRWRAKRSRCSRGRWRATTRPTPAPCWRWRWRDKDASRLPPARRRAPARW